jgi:hypothetical protein
MKTSDLLLLDIKDAILELSTETESDSASVWLYRRYIFIIHALPVVLFLEAVNTPITPADLRDVNELDKLIESATKIHGSNFNGISQDLRRVLSTLPAYQFANMGKQDQTTVEKHQYVVMGARNLMEAIKTSGAA